MTHKTHTFRLLAVAVLAALAFPVAAAAGGLLFQLDDPRGDDHGNGRLIYPLRSDYEKGDLDLVSFGARQVKGGTQFEATFASPIKVPDRQAIDDLGTNLSDVARLGFYTFNIDVYIDKDREAQSGAMGLLPGRNAAFDDGAAGWDRAVVLTPRPNEARTAFQRMLVRELDRRLDAEEGDDAAVADAKALKREIPDSVGEKVFFPQQVRIHGSKVTFFVPDEFLGGPARADWSYLVVVSGADLIQTFDLAASAGLSESKDGRLMILPISPGTWNDRFGGGREGENLQPPLVDIIVPPGESQERLLSQFSSRSDEPVHLPGVVPAEVGKGKGP